MLFGFALKTFQFIAVFFVLAPLASAIIVYTVLAILKNFSVSPRGLFEKFKIRRKESLLKQADAHMELQKFVLALPLLRAAFYFDQTAPTPALADRIGALHLSVLSRLLSISENGGSHLPNLPVIEELLLLRVQLLHGLIEAMGSLRTARGKKLTSGEPLPDWALVELKKKINELKDRLATNQKSLESLLKELFESLRSLAGESQVTYH